jgi:hypothetical protein
MITQLQLINIINKEYIIIPHYLINGRIFGKGVIEHKICVLNFLQLLSQTFLLLKINLIQRNSFINVHKCSRKVILVRF